MTTITEGRKLAETEMAMAIGTVKKTAEACLVVITNALPVAEAEDVRFLTRLNEIADSFDRFLDEAQVESVDPRIKHRGKQEEIVAGEDPGLALNYTLHDGGVGSVLFFGGLVAQPDAASLGITPAMPDQVERLKMRPRFLHFGRTNEEGQTQMYTRLSYLPNVSICIEEANCVGSKIYTRPVSSYLRSYAKLKPAELSAPQRVSQKAFYQSARSLDSALKELHFLMGFRRV